MRLFEHVSGEDRRTGAFFEHVSGEDRRTGAFFEHVSGEDRRTGGLWIEANELRDYDGVTSLPLAVVARLRGLGVVVDDGYDEA